MKKLILCVLTLMMLLGLSACGRRKTEPTTVPTTMPTGGPSVVEPTTTMTIPTMDTNIPDPDIGGAIPDTTTDTTHNTTDNTTTARRR